MKRRQILMLCFALIFFLSASYLAYDGWQAHTREKVRREMESARQDTGEQSTTNGPRGIRPEFASLYEENAEFAGWITIVGTSLDYPVMKPAEDNNYYLTHGPDGSKSKYGAVYLDVASNLEDPGLNLILYGHYFRDGSMFGLLENYKEEEFFTQHPTIQFDTLYEKGTYEIISVFLSKVYLKSEDVFKYYRYKDMRTEEDFRTFNENIQELALYETGETAHYGDQLITLSTCDYWTENGRLVVVAKKIAAEDQQETNAQ